MAQHKGELNFLSRSDGSALYSIDDTLILASVHGPSDVKVSNRKHDGLHLDVCFSPRTGSSNIAEKTIEAIITQTIKQCLLAHLHPRAGVTLTIQEMQSGGLDLSVSINASCLALLDAGIQMSTTFAAVTCCLTNDDVCIVEPSEIELKESKAVLTYVFDGTKMDVITTHQEGAFDCKQLLKCLAKCKTVAKDVFSMYRNLINEKYDYFYNINK
ncbi:UNVERIFIED_CONTAM: hypothetical protein RMT77_002265 [Armadillidium vulgare]